MINNSVFSIKITRKKYTLYFAIITVLIWVLCGGGNVNAAIALLVISAPFSFSTRITTNKMMVNIYFAYIAYTVFITTIFWSSNIDKALSKHQLLKYTIILISTSMALKRVDIENFFADLRNMGMILIIFACIEGITGINFLAILISGNSVTYENGQRAYSIFGHPLLAISFYIFFLLLCFLFPFKKRIIQFFSLSCCLAAILFNRSRSGWLALLLVTFLYVLRNRNRVLSKVIKILSKPSKKGFCIYGVIVITLLGNVLTGRGIFRDVIQLIVNRFSGSFEAGIGKIVRLETIESSLKYWIIEKHFFEMLFGRGKNFDRAFLIDNPVVKGDWVWNYAIDNQYITWIHESGIIGAFFMIIILLMAILRLWRCESNDKCGVLVNSMIIVLMISAFFYEMFNYQLMVSFFCIFIVLSEMVVLKNGKERTLLS